MPESKAPQSVRTIVVYKPPTSCGDCTRVINEFTRQGISVTEEVVDVDHPVVKRLKTSGQKIGMPIVYVDGEFVFNGPYIYKVMAVAKQEQALLLEAGLVNA